MPISDRPKQPVKHQLFRSCGFALALSMVPTVAIAKRPPFAAFEAQAVGHSWKNAYLLAVTSEAANRRRVKDLPGETFGEKFSARFEPMGLEVVTFIDRKQGSVDTQVLILKNDELLLVAFLGSESVSPGSLARDWVLTNTAVALEPIGEGVQVHKGFKKALDLVFDELRETLDDELTPDRRLWLSGHSLGGALASIAGYRLSLGGFPVQGVVGFATPRIGDTGWADAAEAQLGNRLQRWAVQDDPVPRLPLSWGEIRYEPAGTTHVIGDRGVSLEGELGGSATNFANHRMSVHVSGIYYSMPKKLRRALPEPPSLCPWGSRPIGLHPETELPLCKRRASANLTMKECTKRKGQTVGEWCAIERQGKHRYSVYRLKGQITD